MIELDVTMLKLKLHWIWHSICMQLYFIITLIKQNTSFEFVKYCLDFWTPLKLWQLVDIDMWANSSFTSIYVQNLTFLFCNACIDSCHKSIRFFFKLVYTMLNTSSVLSFFWRNWMLNLLIMKSISKPLCQGCNCWFQEWSKTFIRLNTLCLNSPLIFIIF